MVKKVKQHYHWVVAALVFLEMIIYGGLINSFSIFIIPMCESLGVSRGTFSVAIMPHTVMCFLSNMVSGYIFKHFGYMRSAIVSLVLAAGGYVMMACANSLVMLSAGRVVFALGYSICFTAGAVRIARAWFWKHQGLMIGLITMASGIGGSLMTVVLTGIMERTNWRVACMVSAGLLAATAVSFLLLRDRPEDMKLTPFGRGEKLKVKERRTDDGRDWEGFSFQEQLRSPTFYLMGLCIFAASTCVYMISNVAVPHFRSLNFTGAEAASYQSVLMLTLAAIKLVCGGLCDRVGAKPVAVGCMVCSIAGQGLLSVTADPVLCYVGVILLAAGMCMTSTMISLLAMPLFGYHASVSINGIFLAIPGIAAMVSNLISNYSFDAFGSYMPAFRVSAMVNVCTLMLMILLFALAKKDKKIFLAKNV